MKNEQEVFIAEIVANLLRPIQVGKWPRWICAPPLQLDICKDWLTVKPPRKPSNPTLPPHLGVLKLPPTDDLGGFGKHGFDFNPLDGAVGQLGLDDLADQKVFLFGHWHHGGPFGQPQFLGVQRIHNFRSY